MSVTIRLDGAKQLQAALRDMSDDMRAEVGKAVVTTAVKLRGDVVKSIQRGPKSGAVYRKYSPRRTHQASAPGQPPATDTGRLANSIEFDKRGDLAATVGSALAYSVHLEYGTSRMAARPFFRPAVERIRPVFDDLLQDAIKRATR